MFNISKDNKENKITVSGEATAFDMTTGPILPEIVKFAVPLILSFMFQQLYTMIDAVIVSRTIGVMAMAAIGAVDWLDYLMLGIILGMTQGYTSVIARFFGEKNEEMLKRSMGMIIITAIGLLILIVLWQIFFLSKAIAGLHIPSDINAMSSTYCHIYYSGCGAVIFYNMEAAILRGIGDSKSPLKAIIISSLVNIVLDLFFIKVLGTGVGGAAVATVISQVISGIFCLAVIIRENKGLMPERSDFRVDPDLIKLILMVSGPIIFENMIVGISGLIVQRVADGFGSVYLAGFVATNRMYDLINLMSMAFGAATATFVGQNYGAGNMIRIRKGVRQTTFLLLGIYAVTGTFFFTLRKYIVGIFIDPAVTANRQSLEYGMYYLAVCAALLWVLYIGQVFRFALQGLSRTLPMMLSGLAGFAVRAAIAIIAYKLADKTLLFYDEPLAWIGELIFLAAAYFLVMRKMLSESSSI